MIEKYKLTDEEKSIIHYETEMMRFLNHPGVVKFIEKIEIKTHLYIITELVKGGDLFDYITKNSSI